MTQQSMDTFLKTLSSSAPVPGGGGASAYVAAVGMSLGSMVANLTTGKKKYAEYQEEIEQIIEKAGKHTDFQKIQKKRKHTEKKFLKSVLWQQAKHLLN